MQLKPEPRYPPITSGHHSTVFRAQLQHVAATPGLHHMIQLLSSVTSSHLSCRRETENASPSVRNPSPHSHDTFLCTLLLALAFRLSWDRGCSPGTHLAMLQNIRDKKSVQLGPIHRCGAVPTLTGCSLHTPPRARLHNCCCNWSRALTTGRSRAQGSSTTETYPQIASILMKISVEYLITLTICSLNLIY